MPKYLELYKLLNRTFGFNLRPVATYGLIQAKQAFNAITRSLDDLAYSEYAAQKLDRPVFILGNPRSGTTFLHRFLLDTDTFCAFELWEMLFPAVSARKALSGVVDYLAPLSPARFHSEAAHQTGLRDVETDDAMAFFHFVDGGFLWSYFQAWEDKWGSELSTKIFDLDGQSFQEKQKVFSFLESCWTRNLLYKNKSRILVKASTMTLRVKTIVERYPDCRMVYMVRDPIETIPSGMSMITGVLEKSYGMSKNTTPSQREIYFENLYQASCHMFRYFHDTWKAGLIPEKNLRIVPYPRLIKDLENQTKELLEFIEVEPSPDFLAKVKKQAEKQKSRKSEHRYSLSEYNLSEERIRKDLAYVYESFDL